MATVHQRGSARLFSLLFRFRKATASSNVTKKLSAGEMLMLSALNAYNGRPKMEVLPIHELSDRLKTTQPAVTQLVNRLEQKGLVVRESDPADRRTVLVRTTPSGTRAFKKAYEASLQMTDAILTRMGEEQSEQFISLLDAFLTYAQDIISQDGA